MEVNYFKLIAAYLNNYKQLTATVPAFDEKIRAFKLNIAEVNAIEQVVRILNLGGSAGDDSMTNCLCSLATSVANITAAYASKLSDRSLLKSVTNSVSKLKTTKGKRFIQACLDIHDHAKKHIIHLHACGLEDSALDMLKTIAGIYDTVVLPPKLRIGLTDAYERRITHLLRNAEKLLTNEIDIHIGMMELKHPQFSKDYFKIREMKQASV